MRLEKLTESNIEKIKNKKVYCYSKSQSYLEELCNKYEILDNITGIVDENKRNQGYITFLGRKCKVEDKDTLDTVNWEESILLITSDYTREAYEALCQMEMICNDLEVIYYFANKETEYDEAYRLKYGECDLQNMILFRSGPHASSYVKGMDFSDNARALFEYMLKEGYNEKYELVWLVKNPTEFDAYKRFQNVSFVSFDWSVSENKQERDKYYRVLCLAKYIFFTDAYGFARNSRKDQIRVQLWHGCGFKTRVNFVRCEKRYEYTTVISALYAKIHADIYGLRADQVLVTGYAKEDWLFHPIQDDKLREISIPKAKKYIFWLPTFRTTNEQLAQLNEYHVDSQVGLPIIGTYTEMEALNQVLQEMDMILVVKLHPFQSLNEIHCKDFSNICLLDNKKLVLHDIQINQLLAHADALISDYSSAAVDYLLLDRPIAFTLDDVKEYGESRGFVFEDIKNWLPGRELYDYKDFVTFIKEIGVGIDAEKEKRKKIRNVMHDFFDDRSCERIVKTIGISKNE